MSAEEPKKYLIGIENTRNFSAPLSFVSESYLYRTEQRTSLILGIYFGLAGLAAVLAALSAISLRDAAYGLYALSVALMGLTQATFTGIAGLHLWPGSPAWNDLAPLLLPVLTVAALLCFAAAAVSVAERSRRLHRAVQAMTVLAGVAAVAITVLAPEHRFQVMVPYVAASVSLGLGILFWAWRRGDRFGLWLLLGALPVMVASAFPLARLLGLIPLSLLTTHGMQIGIALELPVFLVVLLLRSQQRREHHRRIQGLDRMDPATGLINAQVFEERLQRMVARSQRLRHQSAVVLVDITNHEQIQRDFDRRSAEELPLRVAGRLLSTSREIDSVARLGPLRFGMLVEGPLTPEEAAQIGPRLIARGLMPFKYKPVDWVAQLRVAQAVVPLDGTEARALVARLEGVLGAAAGSRKTIHTLHDSSTESVAGTN